MKKHEELIQELERLSKRAELTAEELIQDRDDPEKAELELARADAFMQSANLVRAYFDIREAFFTEPVKYEGIFEPFLVTD